MVKHRTFIFGSIMYLYWSYPQSKNYASANNILKILNFFKNYICTFWLTYMPKILTPPSFAIVYMMTYCRCFWCLLILYLVANCQMSSGPHGPIFKILSGCTVYWCLLDIYVIYPSFLCESKIW